MGRVVRGMGATGWGVPSAMADMLDGSIGWIGPVIEGERVQRRRWRS